MLQNLTKLFVEKDLSLLEINPLVITNGGNLHCLDAKVNIDSNAIFRQPEIAEMHDASQEDPREAEAAKNDLSYVSLDGNIGCINIDIQKSFLVIAILYLTVMLMLLVLI